MNTKHIFFLLALNAVFLFQATAQNLVLNPSFENTNTNCSQLGGEGFRTDLDPIWDNANSNVPGDSCSSPDLFSACNTLPFIGGPSPTNMPVSDLGFQYSRTGTRHAGIIMYSQPFGFSDNYREYIQGSISTPLTAGTTYCFSMFVNLGDASPYAVQEIGVFFSNTRYLRDACAQGSRINETPHLVNNCGAITDTADWVRLQWDYVATGGESFFVIGNFNNDAQTTVVNTGGGGSFPLHPYAYYYIDDVSIEEASCCYAEINGATELCLTDAPINLNAYVNSFCSTPLSGQWSGNGVDANGVFDPSIADAGTHEITFTLTCGYEATITITVNPCSELTICEDENGNYTVSGGNGPYQWQQEEIVSTPITNSAQCTACGYEWFGVGPIGQCLDGGFGGTQVTACTSTGWATYDNGNSVAPPSSYPIRVIDADGSFVIINSANEVQECDETACPDLVLTLVDKSDVLCNGDTNGEAEVAATGGEPTYTYTWSPGALSGSQQNNLAPGNYTVTVADSEGCTASLSVNIAEPAPIVLSTSSDNPACGENNGSATVAVASGGTGPFSYEWAPSGQTTPSISNIGAGTYTVVVTDANDCTAEAIVNVVSENAPTITLENNEDVSCFGAADGSASVSVTGGNEPYSYAWSPSGGNGLTANNLPAGNYTFTVTDADNCSSSLTVNIGSPAAIAVSGTTIPSSCNVDDGSINVTASGGSGQYTYAWQPNVGNGASVNGLAPGSYQVTATDANGCSANQIFTIGTGDSVIVDVVPNSIVITAGESVNLVANSIPPSPNNTYVWSPADGLSCTTCPNPVASPNETTIYTVTVTNTEGCTGQAPALITVQDLCGDPFVPTIFSPNGDGNNDFLCVQGECIANMELLILNRWGEVVFESGIQADCWDGTFKGKAVNAGVFVYKLKATLTSGKEVLESGNITLVK